MKTFQPGQTVWLETAGERCEIVEFLGAGSHGHVYRAQFGGREFAVKWYLPGRGLERRREMTGLLIEKGLPNNRFLWPMDTALCQGVGGFGCLLPLREPRFRSLADLMNREIDPLFQTLTRSGIELADNFLRLHSMGLCHTDFSLGDIFLDPETGETLMGDNDNLVPDGEGVGGSLGTPRFMAPEIIGGHSRACVSSDLHSLAVILFHLLMVHHPFEGRREREVACLDLSAMQRLYGWDALFIFDQRSGANRPVPGVHNNATLFWNLYPDYVRDIFTRAFTAGMSDPAERVKESEWRAVFTRMRDQIYYCHKCGAENFLTNDAETIASAEPPCWACGETPIPPMRLRLGSHSVVLNQETLLYAHHLDENRLNDFSEVMGEMAPHPRKPDLWGLRNVSQQVWISHPPSGGQAVEVGPGKSVSLVPGLRVEFGNVDGVIA